MRLTERRSEIVVPDEVDELFMVKCMLNGQTTSLLTETGAWNVLTVLGGTDCPGEHRLLRVAM